jgi:hypothetical protein
MRTAEWVLFSAHLPGRQPEPIGILLTDGQELHLKFRSDWTSILQNEDEVEVWRELSEDLARKGRELGSARFLALLESTASHAVRISERQRTEIADFQTTLAELYEMHVMRPKARAKYHSQG